MPKIRTDITIKKVRAWLNKNKSKTIADASLHFNCSESTIRTTLRGIRKDKNKLTKINKKKSGPDICRCCKLRKVWRKGGHLLLCYYCWKANSGISDEDEEYPISKVDNRNYL